MSVYAFVLFVIPVVRADYWTKRQTFIDAENGYAVGANLQLNDKEEQLNRILMRYKHEEYDAGFKSPGKFLPAMHFFQSKSLMEKSDVFKLIKYLPKGASLHSHDTASASGEFLYNLTFRDNLYACVKSEKLKLYFYKTPPVNDGCDWKLLSDIRNTTDVKFEKWLRSQLTLEVEEPKKAYPNINAVWSKFMQIFSIVVPMVTYKPIFEEYFYHVLQEFYDDNVMYVEFRGTLPPVYDLDGRVYNKMEVAGIYKNTTDRFKNDNNRFMGVRLIYGPSRNIDNKTMEENMSIAKELKLAYPDFITGFDLVGQEDLGKPLDDFINELQTISKSMNLYFHAGETNWYGSTDLNLIDALMLGTKRIGHGFAIVKHPMVMSLVKSRKIGVEIAPISNQVLMLVDDIRNHPGNIMIANGLPVVICNDDPGYWGAKGLSYDWYMAFMGMTSRNTDLRFLKQVAMNSFLYSGLESRVRTTALSYWEKDWEDFVVNMMNFYTNDVNV